MTSVQILTILACLIALSTSARRDTGEIFMQAYCKENPLFGHSPACIKWLATSTTTTTTTQAPTKPTRATKLIALLSTKPYTPIGTQTITHHASDNKTIHIILASTHESKTARQTVAAGIKALISVTSGLFTIYSGTVAFLKLRRGRSTAEALCLGMRCARVSGQSPDLEAHELPVRIQSTQTNPEPPV